MNLTTFQTAAEFLGVMRAPLEANDAANSLMYGIALRDEQFPERILTPHFYAALSDGAGVQAAALMTPPHNLVVSAVGDDPSAQAFHVLAEQLLRDGWSVPGVIGPHAAALAFAHAWHARTGVTSRLTFHERLYEVRQVSPAPPTSGQMRQAGTGDLGLIARWVVEFHRDALPDDIPSAEEAVEIIAHPYRGRQFLPVGRPPTGGAGRLDPPDPARLQHRTGLHPTRIPPQRLRHGADRGP